MFTGIIEEVGKVAKIHKQGEFAVLTITGSKIFSDMQLGDSIAVNGVCLTVTEFGSHHFCADVMSETLNRTALGELQPNSPVNLERAMAANGRFGGHIVSGHIDGTGEIISITPAGNAVWYRIKAAPALMRYIIEKGSITIDGISLTVVDCDEGGFRVSIIPHTLAHTTLGTKKIGSRVNLENDIIGKYVEKLLRSPNSQPNSRLSEAFLKNAGF
ncbi:riboflavin synthase [Muribacter muris]|uniref:Riboflavin synthase n=1 Tax=Muribacter muris TaxID=67855 RepID=A0A4Y9JXA1_9PAST|nr:riboflavin synthase [Muribacter muris]MBF0785177.1 riboflavin synthase [Muribacter muris]MBF0827409.1 riboflavin synthase [Muribacter muris]TFV10128.1 riboflavin synthase [Muribacter muris]